MKQSLSLFILAFSLGFFVISCGGGKVDQDSLSRIPASENAVFSVNWKQLLDKAGPDQLLASIEKSKAESEEEDAQILKELIQDPASKGLDVKKSAYGYLSLDGEDPMGTLMLPIANAKKFEEFVAASKTLSTEKKESYTILNSTKSKAGKEVAVGFDGAFLVVCWGEGDLSTRLTNFFGSKPEKSMANNADLKSLLSKGNDINLWVNSTGLYDIAKKDPSNQQTVMGLAFVGLDSKKLDDNNLALSMNFENGKMVMNAKGNFNEKLEKEFGKLFAKGVSKDFRQFIPKTDYIGALALSLNTEELYNYLEGRGLSAMADMQMAKMGLNTKEMLDGLTGNMVVASYENKGSNFRELPSLTIVELKDQAIIDKLMQLAKKNGLPLTKKDNRIYSENMPEAGTLLLKDNFAIFSNSTALLEQVEKGLASGDQLESAKFKKLSEGWMAVDFRDFQQYANFMNAQRNPFGSSQNDTELLKSATISAKGSDIEYVMQTKDEKTNILKQLMEKKANQ
ncbi:hypothetical protein SapgrDRAFT_3380 [Saprospira grandis DSM 2844]|uniref:DUF4836 family protein n=1 Tax=Saprospira grandis DSM 2844 TaxID=694433 RepID=J1I856_9BACT|nr:DUF4836 family protein [Saprospira grandis]EJF55020.1 hypothetical protein SapgrDRAFT_3380 [Saprospira grandis DSM 2844]